MEQVGLRLGSEGGMGVGVGSGSRDEDKGKREKGIPRCSRNDVADGRDDWKWHVRFITESPISPRIEFRMRSH